MATENRFTYLLHTNNAKNKQKMCSFPMAYLGFRLDLCTGRKYPAWPDKTSARSVKVH